ncbi:hypothetical protein CONPUDRAFT_161915 [Coniophora puteana RWD-64-598 SS2]|uniref:WW domain-containing protein n=1 Tax=Coniophora puteana (strain RWD-64-598) TaxID=741705 RepID=A0A5M3N7C0_CONPW|nr:uncharacterized protein CONPUDRAFT_161915 [Coniophora puteana RWD-64-598 SS2]EIW87350.1 hypothetical protein CONPUDRAFT_161915 [Coniophora puteana RWD-64-598 SS2]
MSDLPEGAELVVERLHLNNEKPKYGYYYVCPQSRTLFWLDEYKMSNELTDLKGVKSEEHKKYAVEVEYWTHCELFPHEKRVHQHLFDELRSLTLHAITELLTARTPLSPFSLDELMSICQVLEYVRVDDREGKAGLRCQYSMCILSRYLRMFAESKFVNFHGQKGARLRVNQSIYCKGGQRSYLFHVANILMLGAPDVHMKSLKNIWVDDMLNQVPWKQFVTTLNREWQDYTLYSTIILTANVAFLALPDVTLQGQPSTQTVAQMISFVSTVTSLGSLILSLIMVRQNRIKGHEKVEEAREFMENMANSVLGVDMVAIMYSLPFGFLMWSVISFVIAFAFVAFNGAGTATRILVGVILGLTGNMVLWVVYVSIGSSLSSKSEEKKETRNGLVAGPGGQGQHAASPRRPLLSGIIGRRGTADVENQGAGRPVAVAQGNGGASAHLRYPPTRSRG